LKSIKIIRVKYKYVKKYKGGGCGGYGGFFSIYRRNKKNKNKNKNKNY
jgi:hypothetical protein